MTGPKRGLSGLEALIRRGDPAEKPYGVRLTQMHLIALGANLPIDGRTPQQTLERGLLELEAEGLAVTARSRWYRTPAWPVGSGPDFVNGAAVLEADLNPEGALAVLHRVEDRLGRRRDARWGPRAIDLDLIASNEAVRPDARTLLDWIGRRGAAQLALPPGLLLPHPRMQDRAFVLVPLAEVAPDWTHPVLGATVRDLVAALPEAARAEVRAIT